MAESDIASMFNRPDLAVVAGWSSDASVDQYGGTLGIASPGNILSNASNGIGQVSLGMLALITLGLVGFYVWTRGHQK